MDNANGNKIELAIFSLKQWKYFINNFVVESEY